MIFTVTIRYDDDPEYIEWKGQYYGENAATAADNAIGRGFELYNKHADDITRLEVERVA